MGIASAFGGRRLQQLGEIGIAKPAWFCCFPGVITDGGWSQFGYNGLKELKADKDQPVCWNISLAQMDQVSRGYSDTVSI